MEKKFTVKVNGSHSFELKDHDTEQLDLLRRTPDQFHLLHENTSYHVRITQSDFQNKKYEICINNDRYTVAIENALDTLINDLGFALGSTKKANAIKAPMPGLILAVHVKEGQEIAEGDLLLVLEAMKMENAITAPISGIVKSVEIAKGDAVEKGALMIEFE